MVQKFERTVSLRCLRLHAAIAKVFVDAASFRFADVHSLAMLRDRQNDTRTYQITQNNRSNHIIDDLPFSSSLLLLFDKTLREHHQKVEQSHHLVLNLLHCSFV